MRKQQMTWSDRSLTSGSRERTLLAGFSLMLIVSGGLLSAALIGHAIGWERVSAPERPPLMVTPPARETRPAPPKSEPEALPSPAPVLYSPFPIHGLESLAELQSRLKPEALSLVLKLNRLDDRHIRRGSTLIIPDPIPDWMDLSPFPHRVEALRSIAKIILVSRRVQAFGAYEFGHLVRWGPTSTGKKSTPTPAGLYHTNWKARRRRSTVNPAWLLRWYVNLENREGISFHQYSLPGYPASHACIRLFEDDARWIYHWLDQWILAEDGRTILAQGTPVIVFGRYSYGEEPPWKRLIEDPRATMITEREIEEVLRPYRARLEREANERERLVAQLRSR